MLLSSSRFAWPNRIHSRLAASKSCSCVFWYWPFHGKNGCSYLPLVANVLLLSASKRPPPGPNLMIMPLCFLSYIFWSVSLSIVVNHSGMICWSFLEPLLKLPAPLKSVEQAFNFSRRSDAENHAFSTTGSRSFSNSHPFANVNLYTQLQWGVIWDRWIIRY